jgi:heme ABC exporter ATP-binding subunit CcmA
LGVRFENIDKRYGGLWALRRVSLEIAPGECVVLAGRNGSGKSTLLRIAAQLVRPSAGSVSFSAEAQLQRTIRDRMGFVAHATMVYDELTAEENLLFFAKLQGVARPGARVASLLAEVGLGERKTSLVRAFSRGMRQRVSIARALLREPSLLLLDEPATGLDTEGISWLSRTLKRSLASGCTVVMSLHGESEIAALATRGVRLEAGSVAADTHTGQSLRSILSFAEA